MITRDTAIRAAAYLPALIAGLWVGARSFKGVDEALFRKAVMSLLAVMAVLIGVKAILALNT